MKQTARTHENMSATAPEGLGVTSKARATAFPHVLHLAWKPDTPGTPALEFAVAMASYLCDACREIIVETHERELLDDLDLDELVPSIRSGRIETVAFRTGRVDLAEEWRLALPPSESGSKARCSLTLTVCDNGQSWPQVDWLQASFDHPTPIPTLAIPRGPDGVSVSVFHGLVVLAARFGQVTLAESTTTRRAGGLRMPP